jgi:hypothetical protein
MRPSKRQSPSEGNFSGEIVGKLLNLSFAGRPFKVRLRGGHVVVAWSVDGLFSGRDGEDLVYLRGPRYMDPVLLADIIDAWEIS